MITSHLQKQQAAHFVKQAFDIKDPRILAALGGAGAGGLAGYLTGDDYEEDPETGKKVKVNKTMRTLMGAGLGGLGGGGLMHLLKMLQEGGRKPSLAPLHENTGADPIKTITDNFLGNKPAKPNMLGDQSDMLGLDFSQATADAAKGKAQAESLTSKRGPASFVSGTEFEPKGNTSNAYHYDKTLTEEDRATRIADKHSESKAEQQRTQAKRHDASRTTVIRG